MVFIDYFIVLRCIWRSKYSKIIIVQELQLHRMVKVAHMQELSNCSLPSKLKISKCCKNTTLLILPLATVLLPWRCFHQAKQKVSSLITLEESNFFCLDFLFLFRKSNTVLNLLFIFNKTFFFPLHILYTNKSSFLNIFAYKCTDGYKHKEKKQSLCWNEVVNHLRIVVHFTWAWQAPHTKLSSSQYI